MVSTCKIRRIFSVVSQELLWLSQAPALRKTDSDHLQAVLSANHETGHYEWAVVG